MPFNIKHDHSLESLLKLCSLVFVFVLVVPSAHVFTSLLPFLLSPSPVCVSSRMCACLCIHLTDTMLWGTFVTTRYWRECWHIFLCFWCSSHFRCAHFAVTGYILILVRLVELAVTFMALSVRLGALKNSLLLIIIISPKHAHADTPPPPPAFSTSAETFARLSVKQI